MLAAVREPITICVCSSGALEAPTSKTSQNAVNRNVNFPFPCKHGRIIFACFSRACARRIMLIMIIRCVYTHTQRKTRSGCVIVHLGNNERTDGLMLPPAKGPTPNSTRSTDGYSCPRITAANLNVLRCETNPKLYYFIIP